MTTDPTPMPDEELERLRTAYADDTEALLMEVKRRLEGRGYDDILKGARACSVGDLTPFGLISELADTVRRLLATRARPEAQPASGEEVALVSARLQKLIDNHVFSPGATHPLMLFKAYPTTLPDGVALTDCLIEDLKIVVKALSLPQPPASLEPEPQPVGSTPGRREEIARIVDPEGVDAWDNLSDFANMATPRNDAIGKRYDRALSKADQIMALPSEEGERDPLEDAREALLNMIADAKRWEADYDGDADEYGRLVTTLDYHLTTSHHQLKELVEAVGIKVAYDETPGDALDRALARADQHIGREVG